MRFSEKAQENYLPKSKKGASVAIVREEEIPARSVHGSLAALPC